MNFECTNSNIGYRECYALFSNFYIFHCGEYLTSGIIQLLTAMNLWTSPLTDHVFVSSTLQPDVAYAVVLESGCNVLSDHLPLAYTFNLQFCHTSSMPEGNSKSCRSVL